MRASLVLLLACVVLAFQLQGSEAQFSFSLPGKWGNGKRANTAAWGKRGECGEVDPEAIFSLYKIVEGEAVRMNECLQAKMREESEKH